MSFGPYRKLLRCLGVAAFLWLTLPTLGRAQGCAPFATFGTPCAVGCQTHHCPPHYKHCMEGAPRICWQHGCPRPVCNPCDLPHWGYFETCWNPWPFAPNWGCSTPPPAAFVTLDPYVHPNLPRTVPPTRTAPPMPSVVPQSFPMNPGNGGVTPLPPPRVVDRPAF